MMKNVLLGLAALLISLTALSAQGADALKAASKAFDAYQLEQTNAAKLSEAVDQIGIAMEDASIKNDPAALLQAGEIYAAALIQYDFFKRGNSLGVDEASLPKVTLPGVKAADAFMMAHKTFEKKGKKKAALKGMTELQTNLSNAGIFAIQDKAYADAYANASKGLEMHEYLKTLGAESILDDEKRFEDETYYAAVSALLVEDYAAAKPLYSKLVEMEYEDASIYDGMYKIAFAEGNKEQAVEHLNKGRELFPDDTQLLFTEINYYLGEKKLDVLIGKLENAIAKEPNNVSLYATLGSVYDNLYQKEAKEGNEEKATEYFSSAKEYYEKALEIKPDYASAIYSIGALYFNRGAAMTQELQELGDDFSKEGQKKYEALKTKVDEEFELALPYFKKAEQSDPNDLNILIALKEIYARKGDFELSNEFKDRLEKVQAGETVESYFKS